MFRALSTVYLALILGLPAASAGLALASSAGTWAFWPVCALAPWVALALYVTTAGLLSRPHQRSVRPGRFARDTTTRLYRDRRLYGLCWCAIYYCPPLMNLCLAVPTLKAWMLRLFGWSGSLDVTIYPDTWLRDLPVLDLADGVYIANRATIGTNMVLGNGHILVGAIRIGTRSIVGHLAKIGPGVTIGARSEVGVGTAVGINAKIGDDVVIGAQATVDHGATVGDGARIGTGSYIGVKAVIEAGARVAPGSVIPARTVVRRQAMAPRLSA